MRDELGSFDRKLDAFTAMGLSMTLTWHNLGVMLVWGAIVLALEEYFGTEYPFAKLDNLAAQTPGFTGADLANLVNEAALLAALREGRRPDEPSPGRSPVPRAPAPGGA